MYIRVQNRKLRRSRSTDEYPGTFQNPKVVEDRNAHNDHDIAHSPSLQLSLQFSSRSLPPGDLIPNIQSMRTKLETPPRLLGDQNPDLPSKHSTCLNTPIDPTTTVTKSVNLDTFIDRLDATYARIESIYEKLEKKVTMLTEGKHALETRNRELEKHTAELEAKYKRARESVFGLEVEKLALEERNKRLEATISDMIDKSFQTRDSIRKERSICPTSSNVYERRDARVPFYGSEKPCAPSWSRYEDDESLVPVKLTEEICAKSWSRNEIMKARIPGENLEKGHWESEACTSDCKAGDIRAKLCDENENVEARTALIRRRILNDNANASNTPHEHRFVARNPKPRSDRQVHFELPGYKMDSIEVKHSPDKPGDSQTGEAQLGTMSTGTTDKTPFFGVPPEVFVVVPVLVFSFGLPLLLILYDMGYF